MKYLKDTKANLHHFLIMASDFNIRDSNWDSSYLFHSIHSDTLLNIADLFDLKLSCPIQQIFTWYFNNANDTNLVIDLFFLQPNSIEIDNYSILSELCYPLDHTLLTIDISIAKEFIQYYTIIKNSEKEENFISNLIKAIRNIDMIKILDKDSLELIVQEYARISETI